MYAHFAFCRNMHKISRPGRGNRIWVNRKRKFAIFVVSDAIIVYYKKKKKTSAAITGLNIK